jgi:ectoine hydroxylase-related dioxygenase (phytanoyl-CoA dioxygenase family)
MKRRYQDTEISEFVATAHRDGFCILRSHFPKEKLKEWKEACLPLLNRQIQLEGNFTSRGAKRYYVTFPFTEPFSDPMIFEDPDIIAIVKQLVGEDLAMCQLASDTPLLGSDYQDIHRDCPPLFPETGIETPMYQLALNFPLVDVTPENGPLEMVRGTHMMSREAGLKLIEEGKAIIEPIYFSLGDIIIRDVRTLHRGTPNNTLEPRPMVVIGYNRGWLSRPEVSIDIPKQEFDKLSEFAKQMLRNNPIVESIDMTPKVESYTTFQY